MSTTTKLLPLALLLSACQATGSDHSYGTSPWQGKFEQWGTLQEALRDGQVEGRVRVGDAAHEGIFAVGALEGLRGEVTIVNGEIWISEGAAEQAATTRGFVSDEQATVLFAAEVEHWQDFPVAGDVDPSVFDAFLAEQAKLAGIDATHPFPFIVEGKLRHLKLHVIAGQCPMRSRMLNEDPKFPPYEWQAEATDGRLVGIYATDSGGVVCHAGSDTHVHAIIENDMELTGHVESVGLAAGSTLRLPRP